MLYGFHRLWLLIRWYFVQRRTLVMPLSIPFEEDIPYVTIQLPIYNERFVAARLIDAAATLHWPRDRIEVQILDDSVDDTQWIVDNRAAYWNENGISIKILRRGNRDGFKAGALAHGVSLAFGEFIAVFDADFIPPPDFLLRTVPYFSDPDVGLIQARWGFLNVDNSWLTRIQSLLLGSHFAIEHLVRFRRGLFFNFNGTAGIWRRKAIESAGSWHSDTVTEDLDLSYRAQLAGWRFVYLDDLIVPSELPTTLSAFRQQQQRWAKGSIQTAKKILPCLFRSSLPFSMKIEATAHLLGNLGWFLGAVATLTLYPTVLYRVKIGPYQWFQIDLPLFLGGCGAILLYLFFYTRMQRPRLPLHWVLAVPLLTIGLAPSIAFFVIQGMLKRGGVFHRTPKFGVKGKDSLPSLAFLYCDGEFLIYMSVSILLFIYSLLPIFLAWQRNTWIAMPFLMLFPLSFSFVFLKELEGQKYLRTQEEP